MPVKLIIARHGNTFGPDETPRRVGARTDMELVEKGHEQATRLGAFLKTAGMVPDVVYTSRLKRTIQTAEGALKELGITRALHKSDLFDEIDYGPDENQVEKDVAERLGANAYNAWDFEGVMPREWSPQPEIIRKRWQDFAKHCEKAHDGQTVLVITSNGIARFAPEIANNADDVITDKKRKMGTGNVSLFEGDGGIWLIAHWNHRP